MYTILYLHPIRGGPGCPTGLCILKLAHKSHSPHLIQELLGQTHCTSKATPLWPQLHNLTLDHLRVDVPICREGGREIHICTHTTSTHYMAHSHTHTHTIPCPCSPRGCRAGPATGCGGGFCVWSTVEYWILSCAAVGGSTERLELGPRSAYCMT